MRKTLYVGNWKANKTIPEVEEYFKELPKYVGGWEHEAVLMPSYVNLDCAARTKPEKVTLGAQDVSHWASGEHCGEVTASMLKAVGVKYCLAGHVERRAMGEDNLRVNQKIKNLLAAGITPIVCLGETLPEYKNDMTRVVIEKQIKECLDGILEIDKLVLAYQPAWTFGTGFFATASGDYINIIADFIRKTVVKMTGNPMAANFTILYGGGISVVNAPEYMSQPEIDGLMVGPTSQKPDVFSQIVTTKFKIKKHDPYGG